MSARFSIVTVAKNSEETIRETIESVLSQSLEDFEYILVDGVSEDKTLDIIKEYAGQDSRIRYISEPDAGIYDAMNKGIIMATGEAIGLLNSNDFYETDALEKIAGKLPAQGREEKYVVYGMVRVLKKEKECFVLMNNHEFIPERMVMHPACFVSKAVYKEYLYDTSYKSAADYDLFMRLYQDEEVKFVPVYEVITDFRIGGISSSLVGYIETNDIKYKYGYISKRQHDVGNLGMRIKKRLLGMK